MTYENYIELYEAAYFYHKIKTGAKKTHDSIYTAALLAKNPGARYTVADRKIPCRVGRELSRAAGLNITFAENDIFALALPHKPYDVLICMNLLHDFTDDKCLAILRGALEYCGPHTQILVAEDILTGEFAPKEVVQHGLRLAVYCNGGRQRTAAEFAALFSTIGYTLQKAVQLTTPHTLLVMVPQ